MSAYAGIAQLVERNLAKVEVASSSLVSRSKNKVLEWELFVFGMVYHGTTRHEQERMWATAGTV